MTVYRADCDQYDDCRTGFHATEEAAIAAFWAENRMTPQEAARVRVYTVRGDSIWAGTIRITRVLAEGGIPSPALPGGKLYRRVTT
jgi:hypothetical protein